MIRQPPELVVAVKHSQHAPLRVWIEQHRDIIVETASCWCRRHSINIMGGWKWKIMQPSLSRTKEIHRRFALLHFQLAHGCALVLQNAWIKSYQIHLNLPKTSRRFATANAARRFALWACETIPQSTISPETRPRGLRPSPTLSEENIGTH